MPSSFRSPLRPGVFTAPNPFQNHLQDEEQILWQGRPNIARYVRRKVTRDALIGLPLVLLGMWLESLRTGTLVFGSPSFWIVGLIAFVGTVAYLAHETQTQAEWTHYAISSRRVFFRYLVTLPTKERQVKVADFSLEGLHPRHRAAGSAFGTITFGFPVWKKYTLAFRDIPSPDDVFQILTQAQARLPQTQSRPAAAQAQPYYAKRAEPTPSTQPFTLEEHLRSGEYLVWRGEPDVHTYVRREMRIGLLSAIFLLALFGGIGLTSLSVFTWPIFAVSLAIGSLLAAVGLAWGLTGEAQSLHYAATNQRAMILKSRAGQSAAWDSYELADARKMRLVASKDGIGTLIFEKRHRFVWHGQGGTVATYEFSFKSIPGAADVLAQVTQARATHSTEIHS